MRRSRSAAHAALRARTWRACPGRRRSSRPSSLSISTCPSTTTTHARSVTWWSPSSWPALDADQHGTRLVASGGRPARRCRRACRSRSDPRSAREESLPRLVRLERRAARRRTALSGPRPDQLLRRPPRSAARRSASSSTRAAIPADLAVAARGDGHDLRAILVTHGHWDHLVGVAGLAEGTGAPVHMPAGERQLLEEPAAFWGSAPVAIRAHVPEVVLEGGETVDRRRHRLRGARRPGPLARAHRLPRRGLPLLRRRALRGLGRPRRHSRRRLGHAAGVDPEPGRPLPARDRRLRRDTARRRPSGPSSPGTRSSRSSARLEQVRGARGARTTSCPPSSRSGGTLVGGGRTPVRARRLPAHRYAVLRGHRAVRSHVGRGLRRRAARRCTPSRTEAAAR